MMTPYRLLANAAGGAAHESVRSGGEQVHCPAGTIRAAARVGLPVPVVQGHRRVDLLEESLVAVDQLAVPRDKCRTAVDMGCLMNLVLLVPERHTIGIRSRIQLQDGVAELVTLRLGHFGDVPPD